MFREEYQRHDREVKKMYWRDKKEYIKMLIREAEETAGRGE
jgi:hypothetical protein